MYSVQYIAFTVFYLWVELHREGSALQPGAAGLFIIKLSISSFMKLDRVGAINNRPSTDKLHQIVKKTKTKNKKNYM